jgi:hypothetical protein
MTFSVNTDASAVVALGGLQGTVSSREEVSSSLTKKVVAGIVQADTAEQHSANDHSFWQAWSEARGF